MRVLMRISFPVENGNEVIKNGKIGEILQSALGALKPEAAYFTAMGGERGGFIVFDPQDPSQIPSVAEPFFLALNADVEIMPVMTAEDVAKGTASLGDVIQKYGS